MIVSLPFFAHRWKKLAHILIPAAVMFVIGCNPPPDEDLVVFCARYDDAEKASAGIFTMNIDAETDSIVHVADDTGLEPKAVLSPDHTQLAYISEGLLYVMDVRERKSTELTQTDPQWRPTIAWSQDGTQLATLHGETKVPTIDENFLTTWVSLPTWKIINVDGSGENVQDKLTEDFLFATRSPDGKLFTTINNTGYVEVREQGSERLYSTLPTLEGYENYLRVGRAWSPDGKQLLLWVVETYNPPQEGPTLETEFDWAQFSQHFQPSAIATLFIANVDGTGLTQITARGVADADITPAWSPDGTRIIYGAWLKDTDGDGVAEYTPEGASRHSSLVVIEKDGGNPRELLDETYNVLCADW